MVSSSMEPPTGQRSHLLERPVKLVPAIVGQILDRIVSGEFMPGQLLPKESEIIDEYGVSRTVIREALRVLEEKGLISIQQGRGTVVNEPQLWNLLDPQVMSAQVAHDESLTVLENLADVRAALEAELTRAAVPRMGPAEHAELAEQFGRLTEAIDDVSRYLGIDQDFHDVILRAARNPLGRQIVRNIHGWNTMNPIAPEFGPDAIARAHSAHRAIFELVEAGEERVVLQTDNEPAIALYRSAGWVVTDRLVHNDRGDGVVYDEHVLVKRL